MTCRRKSANPFGILCWARVVENHCGRITNRRPRGGEIIEHSINDRDRKGCFPVNSALENAPHRADCRAVVAGQFFHIEAFFKRCILAAKACKTVPPNIDAADTARLLLGVLLGIRAMARTNPDRDVLEGIARPAPALLDLPSRKKRGKR